MKSFVTGLWLASVGLGNMFFNVPVGWLYPIMEPGVYYLLLTITMIIVTVVFLFVGRRFNRAMDRIASANPEAGGA